MKQTRFAGFFAALLLCGMRRGRAMRRRGLKNPIILPWATI
jgi:hypothetical protein